MRHDERNESPPGEELIKQFGRLTNDDLKEAQGDREQLLVRLMARYQLTHAQAEQRLFNWEQTMY